MARKKKDENQEPEQEQIQDSGLPPELEEELSPKQIADDINDLHAQGAALGKASQLLALIETEGGTLQKIFQRSGFPSIASHFKGLRERGAAAAREINKVKPHGRLVFAPDDWQQASSGAQQAQ